MSRVCGRFAPSPTGPLHFGSLIAALGSYCDARARGGRWLLRIEDVDEPRSRPDAEHRIIEALVRYGFRWDGDIVRQSERTSLYRRALDKLVDRGLAYPCVCTRRELEHAPMGAGGERIYPGTCRRGIALEHADSKAIAWRVRVDEVAIDFVDRLQGLQSQRLADAVGDFVIRRSDGLFAYQLAVVVDDAEQGVTDVVRGADLLTSTPRQRYLQRLLGFDEPRYLHLPIAIDAHGEKLSKQTRATVLPDTPLDALWAAWRFLDQPMPHARIADADAFWRHAFAHWTPSRLPPVAMLPAPAAFAAKDSANSTTAGV